MWQRFCLRPVWRIALVNIHRTELNDTGDSMPHCGALPQHFPAKILRKILFAMIVAEREVGYSQNSGLGFCVYVRHFVADLIWSHAVSYDPFDASFGASNTHISIIRREIDRFQSALDFELIEPPGRRISKRVEFSRHLRQR